MWVFIILLRLIGNFSGVYCVNGLFEGWFLFFSACLLGYSEI